MKWNSPVLVAVCLSVAFSAPRLHGAGHHAIGDIYDEERTIVLAGEVESFLFGNPHALFHVRVVDDGGRVRTWARARTRAVETLPEAGHHAIGDIYDEERTIVLAGEVESFLFGNPHSLLHVRVVDDGGRAHTWAVEWRAANRLSRAGLTGDALAPGDAVTLCGHPGRDPAAYRLYLLNVARSPNGSTMSPETRAAFCEREASPEIADLPARWSSPERPAGLVAR